MSLIVTMFAIVFFTQLISWVGQSVLLERAYGAYLRLFQYGLITQRRKLKADILNTKAELMRTSAQDHFAKWAKLRRSVDKGLADLEKLNSELATAKTTFSMKFNTFIWVLTTGLQFAVGLWYRNSPVFYVPPGWFGPLTWWLAFPFAPKGSVSVGIWQMACKRVILIGERVVKDFIGSPELAESENENEVDNKVPQKKES
ncbi:hypothetical protein BDN72DRAFT_843175 [Pluteus cervinus]|uniref:Uncharacterized protein n=1 Tax=Pluteus cervinus TaxID=181527 RepID=A0ACD3APF5_9AGAR|nr:hypothetical protein BDN72DRAFT_843175 [Pluteus cervinus]